MKSLVHTNQIQRAVPKYKKAHHVDGRVNSPFVIVLVMANLHTKYEVPAGTMWGLKKSK